MNVKLIITIIVISLLNLGCHCASQIGDLSFYPTDRPVMLGKVQKIGSAAIQPGIKKNNFKIEHYSSDAWLGVLGVTHTPKVWETSDSTDTWGELKKKVDAPDNLIKVDTVYFRSVFAFFTIILITFGQYHSATGIHGGVYEGKSVDQVEDSVKAIRDSGEKL